MAVNNADSLYNALFMSGGVELGGGAQQQRHQTLTGGLSEVTFSIAFCRQLYHNALPKYQMKSNTWKRPSYVYEKQCCDGLSRSAHQYSALMTEIVLLSDSHVKITVTLEKHANTSLYLLFS